MRIGRRLMKALIWGLVLCLSILGGGLWFAYWYVTDGDTFAQLIREHAVRFFPRSILDPGRVHISLYGGKVSFRELRMIQKIDGLPFELLRIPWLDIRIDAKGSPRANWRRARWWSASRRCDCAGDLTAPGTSKACSRIPGRVRGSRRRRS